MKKLGRQHRVRLYWTPELPYWEYLLLVPYSWDNWWTTFYTSLLRFPQFLSIVFCSRTLYYIESSYFLRQLLAGTVACSFLDFCDLDNLRRTAQECDRKSLSLGLSDVFLVARLGLQVWEGRPQRWSGLLITFYAGCVWVCVINMICHWYVTYITWPRSYLSGCPLPSDSSPPHSHAVHFEKKSLTRMCGPHLRNGDLFSPSLRAKYLRQLLEVILREPCVSITPIYLFIQSCLSIRMDP